MPSDTIPQTQAVQPRPEPIPFRIHIPDEQLARLRRKLEDYQLPQKDIVNEAGWAYGVSLDWVKGLKKYWLEEYDWRKAEADINRFVPSSLGCKVLIELQLEQLQSRNRRS